MVKRSRGLRSRTRRKLSRRCWRECGLSPITRALQKFNLGDKACVVIDPSIQQGHPHPRYQGYTGVIVGNQGRAYKLQIRTGNKYKVLIVTPEHLRKIKS